MKSISSPVSQIYEFYYDEYSTNEVLNQLLNAKLKWREYLHFTNETKLSVNNSDDAFYNKNLYDWVEDCINKVGKIHFPSLHFAISDSWISKTELNEKLRKHKHINSIFSAVFYCDNSKTPINFYIPDPIASQYENILGKTVYKEHLVTLNPKKGQLLVFDSQLYHNVNKHIEIEPRYSVVFNSFFHGKLNVKSDGITEDTDRLQIEVKYL